MTKKKSKVWLSLTIIWGLSAGFSSAQAADGTLKVVPHADLRVLDPIAAPNYITRNHGYLVFDTLFSVDSGHRPKPQMVDTTTVSDDLLTYTFTLRDGLTWHDETRVTAADCVASLRRWMKKSPPARELASRLKLLEASDDKTIKLVLTEPFALVLDTLAVPSPIPAFMMPERLAASDPNIPVPEAIGSGPFMFAKAEWQPGAKVVYVRNKKYRPRVEPADFLSGGKVAKVERVEWIILPDPNAAVTALKAGEVDYVEQPGFEALSELKSRNDIKLQKIDPIGELDFLRPNHLHPPFNTAAGRQALRYLVDQKNYMQAIVGDPEYYRTCYSYLTCGGPYEVDTGKVEPDIQKATALFKEAGYNGEKVVLLQTPTIPHFSLAAQITAQKLRKAGINLDVQVMEWNLLVQRRNSREAPEKGGWSLLHTGMGGVDAESPLSNILFRMDCNDPNPGTALGWPCDKDFEASRAEWMNAADEAGRKAAAQKMQARALEMVPHVLIGQFTKPVAYRRSVTGVLDSGIPVFWNIEKKQ